MQHCVLLHVAANVTNLFCKKITQDKHTSEAYLELSQTSDMELFKKIAGGFKSFLIFAKSSILDIWQSPEYTSLSIEICKCFIL